jgi:hypothetical protein
MLEKIEGFIASIQYYFNNLAISFTDVNDGS